ncbi:hypothetical protein AOCH_002783 [Aspergillus ochraceoroseus]|uniref:Uncharacterized protein n=1 Tax=Aspergillus ochraceoroseus TaxID=138278 RepID=A0A0F8UWZ8_9EURO|nr:hypothetical protein AOCH_002783 [Aspergillus ochraceoroseus]
MKRDGLFVDISFTSLPSGDQCTPDPTDPSPRKIVRLCNTHLESLVSVPPIRPVQLKVASQYMHGASSGGSTYNKIGEEEAVVLPTPHAALLAGDLNAFAPEDGTAPTECGLQDVFLKLGGQEGTEEAFTWGQQVPLYIKKKFGCSRMDKVLFCGGIEPLRLQKIGEGVKAWVQYPEQSDEDSTDSTDDGEEVWATDHIGLCAELQIL